MGIALTAGYVAAIALGIHRRHRSGLSAAEVIQVISLVVLFAFAGSKLYYFSIHHADASIFCISYWTTTTRSGSYGAVLGGLLAVLVYSEIRRVEFLALADHLAPSWLVAGAFGRVGCFVSGCCYGLPTQSSGGIRYSTSTPAGLEFPNQRLVPVQLLEACGVLVLIVGLLFAERSKRADGQLAGYALIGYAVIRFCLDLVRYYPEHEVAAHVLNQKIVISQVMSLLLAVLGIAFVLGCRRCLWFVPKSRRP